MEPRLCRYLFFVFLMSISTLSFGQCGDMEYINWMSEIVQRKKEKLGGLAEQIPTSLAVAQAALETGYGESYSAQKRKNHFGLRSGKRHLVFTSAQESVVTYLETLSEKSYYKRVQNLLKKGETDPFKLLKVLAPIYAPQEDESYIAKISAVIRSCDLISLDVASNGWIKNPC